MRLSFQPFLFDRFLSDFSFSTKFYIIHSSITERNPLPSNVRVVSKSQTQSLSSQDGLTSRFKTFRLLHQDLCNLHIERCHKSIVYQGLTLSGVKINISISNMNCHIYMMHSSIEDIHMLLSRC